MKQKFLLSKKILARAGILILVPLLGSLVSSLQVRQVLPSVVSSDRLLVKDVLRVNIIRDSTITTTYYKEFDVKVRLNLENDNKRFDMCLDFNSHKKIIYHKNIFNSGFFDLHHLEVNQILYNQSCNMLNKKGVISYV